MTHLNRLACIATAAACLLGSSALAFQAQAGPNNTDSKTDKPVGYTPPEALTPLITKPKPGLEARKPMPKPATVRKPERTFDMLVVKFGDPVVGPGAVTRSGAVELNPDFGQAEAEVKALVDRFNLTFRHAVPQDQTTLQSLYEKAEQRSGRMQPNLKSYFYVEGDPANLDHVANVLNGMETVEVVRWYEDTRPTMDLNRGGDPPEGGCCMPDNSCEVLTEAACLNAGGMYDGDGTDCEPNPCNNGACCVPDPMGGFGCIELSEQACHNAGGYFQGDGEDCTDDDGDPLCDSFTPDCGEPGTGGCFWIDGENGTPYCNDLGCCELICDFDPFCCEEQDPPGGRWDETCASTANLICQSPPADRCQTPFNDSCLEPHFSGGCANQSCCETVIAMDPACNNMWDAGCVELARNYCGDVDAVEDFTATQGYRTPQSYLAQLGEIPDDLEPVLPVLDSGNVFLGFGGEGWNLFDPDDPFGGLYGLGQELLDDFGVDEYGEGVLTRGKTIKVGVIEWGWWGPEPFEDDNGNGEFDAGEPFTDVNDDGQYTTGHEDLDVITEPGQTLLLIPQITSPDHGTACLGIINSIENAFGMTGIAPDADAYFFPLTSVEEGPRELAAWTSALAEFGPGDVLSASYGPGPPTGNLNNDAIMWPIFRMASDLGITVCVAAGNDCFNLDDAPDLGDSGAIVCGASSPGTPYYRLAFSNFCTNPDNERSNIVHLKAWGTYVASCGYGDLAAEDGDPYRSYTIGFGGTSAATPQLAGLVACLQGLAKQFYGIPLPPETIRGAMGAPGTPPSPPTRLFGGFDTDGDLCSLDLDPDIGPHMIGPYPVAAGDFGAASSAILNQSGIGFDDSPNVNDVVVLNGEKIFGSKFSVKGSDNTYFVVQSEQADFAGPSVPSNLPANIPPGVVNSAQYAAPGEVADLLVIAESPVNIAGSINVFAEVQGPPDSIVVTFVEAYDWFSSQWEFVGVTVLNGSADLGLGGPLGMPQRFLRPSNKQILVRVWGSSFGTTGGLFGDGSGRVLPYLMRYDWVTVDVTEGFATPSNIPPGGFFR